MAPLARAAVAVPAIAVLAACAWTAVKQGSAATEVYEASREIASRKGAVLPDSVHERLAKAVHLAPASPTAHEMLGQWEAARIHSDEGLRDALQEFRIAVRLRPTSPYAWASIARLEYMGGRTGPDFQAALATAADLGPSEPEVQRTVIDLGLAAYDEIGNDTRRAVLGAVERAARRDEKEVLTIAQRRGRLAAVCGRLAASPLAASTKSGICQGTEAQP